MLHRSGQRRAAIRAGDFIGEGYGGSAIGLSASSFGFGATARFGRNRIRVALRLRDPAGEPPQDIDFELGDSVALIKAGT